MRGPSGGIDQRCTSRTPSPGSLDPPLAGVVQVFQPENDHFPVKVVSPDSEDISVIPVGNQMPEMRPLREGLVDLSPLFPGNHAVFFSMNDHDRDLDSRSGLDRGLLANRILLLGVGTEIVREEKT